MLFDRLPKDRKMEESVNQMQPLNEKQIANSEGGYVWQVTDMNRLHRFLCFGSEGGTYYIKEQKLGLENAEALIRLIEDGRGSSPGTFRECMALPILYFQTSGLQNYERINLCCVNPPGCSYLR